MPYCAAKVRACSAEREATAASEPCWAVLNELANCLAILPVDKIPHLSMKALYPPGWECAYSVGMKILSAQGGLAATNCYLIADEVSKHAVLIDAPDHTVAPLLQEAKSAGYTIDALWMTHGHWDHLADHKEVSDAFPGVQKLIHKLDEPKLQKPGSAIFRLPFAVPPGEATGYLEDGQILTVGGLKAQVIFTPGHCPGHVCFYFEADKILVGGDLIIGGAVGRTDLPGCSVEDLMTSVRRIMQLPDDTALLPGHGEASTLGDERENNAYVRRILAGRTI